MAWPGAPDEESRFESLMKQVQAEYCRVQAEFSRVQAMNAQLVAVTGKAGAVNNVVSNESRSASKDSANNYRVPAEPQLLPARLSTRSTSKGSAGDDPERTRMITRAAGTLRGSAARKDWQGVATTIAAICDVTDDQQKLKDILQHVLETLPSGSACTMSTLTEEDSQGLFVSNLQQYPNGQQSELGSGAGDSRTSHHFNPTQKAMERLNMPIEPIVPSIREEGTWSFARGVSRWIVRSSWFEYLMGMVILLNSLSLGIQSQIELTRVAPAWLRLLENVFLITYLIELWLRVMANGWRNLKDRWFIIDCFLVAIGCTYTWVFEELLQGSAIQQSRALQQVLLLRTLRLLRLLRALRRVPFLRDAWRLVHGLLTSTHTMLSTLALLVLMLYIFACVGLEVITKDPSLGDLEDFDNQFGSILAVMCTLLQFVTMDSVASIYLPLIRRQPLLVLYFVPILVIISIALMNLVTAALVEGALKHAHADEDARMYELTKRVKKLVPSFRELFCRINVDKDNGPNAITVGELDAFDWSAHHEGLAALEYFEFDSMVELFEVLDADGSGELDQEEFVEGLVSLSLAQHNQVPRELFLMMKLMRIIKRRFNDVEVLIERVGRENNLAMQCMQAQAVVPAVQMV